MARGRGRKNQTKIQLSEYKRNKLVRRSMPEGMEEREANNHRHEIPQTSETSSPILVTVLVATPPVSLSLIVSGFCTVGENHPEVGHDCGRQYKDAYVRNTQKGDSKYKEQHREMVQQWKPKAVENEPVDPARARVDQLDLQLDDFPSLQKDNTWQNVKHKSATKCSTNPQNRVSTGNGFSPLNPQ
ncbi:hypothetical protein HAX54_032064 [Datura stramonium]|uniref:Uncharacterized protein n=1 Tax=Datura stramonium TaxID=4076 RepID=A0ABS8VCJ7_DATST|nr:hypothetical protein [Datura stramonium]